MGFDFATSTETVLWHRDTSGHPTINNLHILLHQRHFKKLQMATLRHVASCTRNGNTYDSPRLRKKIQFERPSFALPCQRLHNSPFIIQTWLCKLDLTILRRSACTTPVAARAA